MIIKNLYRYRGEGGTVDTTVLLPIEHEDMYRLCADDGKILTDGEKTASVIDIPASDIDKWAEVDAEEGEK